MRFDRSASRHCCGAVLVVALLAVLTLTPPAAAGEVDAGRQKAEICTACHGPDGKSEIDAVPSIAGQRQRYLVLALYQYRAGRRQSEQMTPVTAELTDDDLGDLAAYFAAQTPAPPQHATDPDKAAAAQRLAGQDHCAQCHGPALGGQEHIPRLAGQHLDYVKNQLRGFKAGTRADIDGLMTSAAQALSDADIDLLADYIAGLH